MALLFVLPSRAYCSPLLLTIQLICVGDTLYDIIYCNWWIYIILFPSANSVDRALNNNKYLYYKRILDVLCLITCKPLVKLKLKNFSVCRVFFMGKMRLLDFRLSIDKHWIFGTFFLGIRNRRCPKRWSKC